MIQKIKLPVLITVLMLLAACTMPHPPLPYDPNNPLKRVAVLPMRNDTTTWTAWNDAEKNGQGPGEPLLCGQGPEGDGPDTERPDGDHARRAARSHNSPETRAGAGVEGVLYGTLMDFDETTTGVINVKKVRGKFKLVNTLTGQPCMGARTRRAERNENAGGRRVGCSRLLHGPPMPATRKCRG